MCRTLLETPSCDRIDRKVADWNNDVTNMLRYEHADALSHRLEGWGVGFGVCRLFVLVL